MFLRILYIPNISTKDIGELKAIQQRLSQISVSVPRCFTIEGGARKFLVLQQEGDVPEMLLVIGPELEPTSYYHKALLTWVQSCTENGSVFKPKGGGFITFRCAGGSGWTATFHGESGDFGVYNPAILEQKDFISQALELKVVLEWKS
jgi:hypothetical protein